MIATVTGLSTGTVGKVRQRSTGQSTQSTTRVGRDGRVRPIDGAAGRKKVGELLAEKPTASIRAIAKEAGVSPSTVHDVRQRLSVGQCPVLERRITGDTLTAGRLPSPRNPGDPGSAGADIASILASLKRDPSLRFSDSGRSLLHWLDRHRVGMTEYNKIAEMVPDHCANLAAKLARSYASVWTEFAAHLERRRP